MRALIVGPEQQAAIDKVVAYAMEPQHWYRPGPDPARSTAPVPGENPAYTVHVPDGFRCVFTFTEHQGRLFRHLTVSVNGPLLPSPEACVMLARAFGFTSAAAADDLDITARMERDGWLVSTGHEGEHCVVLVQAVEGASRV